jgi:murein DD-endopeptidase MepM/ murein hydrolase activator NlpD
MATRFSPVRVLPDTTAAAQKADINQRALAGLPAGAAVLLIVGACVCYQNVALPVRLGGWRPLRPGANAQAGLATRVTQREAKLDTLGDVERRGRVEGGLDQPESWPAPLAQGGADTVTRTTLLASLKQRTGRVVQWGNRDLTALGEQFDSGEQSLREPKTSVERKTAVLAATPTILPVMGVITAGYGYRKSPFTGAREFHEGLDIAAPDGTPILATADGIVFFAAPLGAYGNVVFLDHGHGFATFYGHNSTNWVREGQRVHRGDIIAYVGTTGRTTGPHVHYVIYVRGKWANPVKYTGPLTRAVHR